MTDDPTPPEAKCIANPITRHGDTLTDDYAWLRDENWQEVMRDPSVLSQDIRDYLEAENAYTEAQLADTTEMQAALLAKMRGRIKEDDSTVPAPDGAFEYYVRYDSGAQHPLFCRRSRNRDDETIILNGQIESAGQAYFRISGCRHSPDHRFAFYGIDLTGSEHHDIHFKDLETGQLLDDLLQDAQGDVVWANDSQTVFYTVRDEEHRPSRIYRHRLGDDPATDSLIYQEDDPAFYLDLGKTESGRFILIEASGHSTTTEVRFIDAERPDEAPVLFAARETGHSYTLSDHGDNWYILTNMDGAIDFKIMSTPLDNISRSAWTEVAAHRDGRFIRQIALFSDHLVWLERENALPRINVTRLSDGASHEIAFDEDAYDLGMRLGYEFETSTLRISYSSMTTPSRIFDYDMNDKTRVLCKEQEIPSGHDPADYVTRRLWAPSHDGVKVPVTILHRADAPLDGSDPVLLYGYGAYGISMPASFSANRLSLVDRGFIYAIAHIRGGSDCGFGWYEDGKLHNKANTFKDFIAAGEHLVNQGMASVGNIVANGRSAGGMLMGAVANMRPDLFRAVVAEVPFVDVMTTMCDTTLPLTPPEWTEWGNPIEDENAYQDIRAYSPYDNVTAQSYPNILAVGGLTDPRVTYWEPTKWIARLRAQKTDHNICLLHTVMEAGHGGASGRFDRLEEIAMVYAFMLKMCGRAD
ncbi:MAG: S9 family peptidase [Proteobacteria bacterium]|nr:S9 family peptidase [Pseudomonadota bacterium]